jgi:hypothetical protein
MLEDIEDPVERFVAFIEEREGIRARRANKLPWPWTKEPILQQYRFTNIHREDDTVSKHYQKTIRERYAVHYLVYPGTVLYRWFNRSSTCDVLFNEPLLLGNQSTFEEYIYNGDMRILLECLNKIPTPHVTGSYIITGAKGFTKGEGVIQYFHRWNINKQWREKWMEWVAEPPTLKELFDWTKKDVMGLGNFMTAQIVADLKYLPFMQQVPDWWTWASPGPGSMRGMNFVLGIDMNEPWRVDDWLRELTLLNEKISPTLEEVGLGRFHNQDLQNCLCEYSKFMKTVTGKGRPRQTFKHREG